MTDRHSFASTSLPRHLARGTLGFGALAGAVLLIPAIGLASLLLAPLGLLALRGCPLCWTIGLLHTISNGRLQRSCVDGHCELSTARHTSPPKGATSQPRAPQPYEHNALSR
ncbi:hypothetical protein [Streptomyces sp. NRRL B-1347]|uniref:hypothetical protein n=1 Tax=Streptomyces sp. NRRL B-1347 TaxID=1476877 RepID=UPI0004C56EEC|nr:hypothetical protein [Streptomyces sp. NRRL B-1347]